MTSERVLCKIPTPNAVKVESISCSLQEANFVEGWTMLAGCVTAVATLLLAAFAWRAWLNAKDTLQKMKEDSE